jgi:hypothetical protein
MGCNYNGNISLPDSSWDIFNVTMTASQCGQYNGNYSGLALYEQDSSSDYLDIMVSNNQYSVLTSLTPM